MTKTALTKYRHLVFIHFSLLTIWVYQFTNYHFRMDMVKIVYHKDPCKLLLLLLLQPLLLLVSCDDILLQGLGFLGTNRATFFSRAPGNITQELMVYLPLLSNQKKVTCSTRDSSVTNTE